MDEKVIQMTPVKEVALEYNLPVYQPEKLSGSQEMDELMNLGADGIVTAAFWAISTNQIIELS